MSEQHHDSPYKDASSSSHHGTSKPSSSRSHSSPRREPSGRPARKHASAKHAAPHQARAHGPSSAHAAKAAPARKRRRRGAGVYKQPDELTSHPTTRNAYVETRLWLLKTHGPVCAYCGTKHNAKLMTLDHVAPRRGQTAYDRRDNLVLACQTCNAAKRDMAPLAFLLGVRARARNLLRYGAHLSAGLIEMARSLVPEHELDAIDSPYRD